MPSHSLQAKPCLCCGREISPRSKWARNWNSIKFCSDQCRSWRAVVTLPGHVSAVERASLDVLLASCLEEHGDKQVRLHLDAWIEAAIWSCARRSTRHALRTLADVSNDLHRQIQSVHDDPTRGAITAFLQKSKAGEREILRRAARRLVVLPRDRWACTQFRFDIPIEATLVLTQRAGRQRLMSLSDVSHAKGEIEISLGQK